MPEFFFSLILIFTRFNIFIIDKYNSLCEFVVTSLANTDFDIGITVKLVLKVTC